MNRTITLNAAALPSLSHRSSSCMLKTILLPQLRRPAHCFFFGLTVLRLTSAADQPESVVGAGLFVVLLSMNLIAASLQQHKRNLQVSAWNSKEVLLWMSSYFAAACREQLTVGHIVKLHEGEEVPADLLTLATSEDSTEYYARHVGSKQMTKKKAVSVTHEFIQCVELNKLQGTVSVSATEFFGKLQLTTECTPNQLSAQHFIARGSVVYGVNYIIALVVFTGSDCCVHRGLPNEERKTSPLERQLNIWTLCFVAAVLLLNLITRIVTATDNAFAVELILVNSHLLPLSLYLVFDLVRLVHPFCLSLFTRRKILSEALETVGSATYAVVDKAGILTTGDRLLTHCYVDGRLYTLTSQPNFGDCSSIDSLEAPDSSFAELQLATDSNPAAALFRGLSVSYIGIVNKEGFLSSSPDETALASQLSKLNHLICYRTKTESVVKINGTIEKYKIIGENKHTSASPRSRVIAVDCAEQAVMYTKGPVNAFINALAITEDAYAELVELDWRLRQEGARPMLLASRTLEIEELIQFKHQKLCTGSVSTTAKLDALFESLEVNMTVLGLVGLTEVAQPETAAAVASLKQSGVKLWVVSEESASTLAGAGRVSGLFDAKYPVVELVSISNQLQCFKALEEAINVSIFQKLEESAPNRRNTLKLRKYTVLGHADESFLRFSIDVSPSEPARASDLALAMFPKFLSTNKNSGVIISKCFKPETVGYSVVLDKKSLQLALSHEESRKLLVYLLFAADTVCVGDLSPSDKATVVNLLAKNFSFAPTIVGIGKSESSLAMMQATDFAIGIKSEATLGGVCAVLLPSIASLPTLFELGNTLYSRLAKTITFSFYKSVLAVGVALAYRFQTEFAAAPLIDPSWLLVLEFCITLAPLLYLALWEDVHGSALTVLPRSINMRTLVKYVSLALAHSTVIWGMAVAVLPEVVEDEGKTGGFSVMQLVGFITIALTTLGQFIVEVTNRSVSFYASVCISFICLCVILILSDQLYVHDGALMIILSSPILVCVSLGTPLICVLISLVASAQLSHPRSLLAKFADNLHAVYKPSSNGNDAEPEAGYQIQKFSLKFNCLVLEQSYLKETLAQKTRLYRKFFGLCLLAGVAWVAYEIFVSSIDVIFILLTATISAGLGVAIYILSKEKLAQYHKGVIMLVIATVSFSLPVFDMLFGGVSILVTGCLITFNYIIFSVDWFQITLISTCQVALCFLSLFLHYPYDYEGLFSIAIAGTLELAIFLASMVLGYSLEHSAREQFLLTTSTKQSAEKRDSLLSFLLPDFVKERVKAGSRCIADEKDTVTVIFCDICDFDQICNEFAPEELTAFLHRLFWKFDLLCESMGVTKIETVSKTYMACVGLAEHLEMNNQAKRATDLAFGMRYIAQGTILRNGKSLQVKIGIHSGPVTAGVVGLHKPQFSLVGDTVNTASRMCSTLKEPNLIQISEATRSMIHSSEGLCFVRNEIEAKGKGKMKTYLLYEGESETTPNSRSVEVEPVSRPAALVPLVAPVSTIWSVFRELLCYKNPEHKEHRRRRLADVYSFTLATQLITLVTLAALLALTVTGYLLLPDWFGLPMIVSKCLGVVSAAGVILMYKRLHMSRVFSLLFAAFIVVLALSNTYHLVMNSAKPIKLITLEVMYLVLVGFHTNGMEFKFIFTLGVAINLFWAMFTLAAVDYWLHLQSTLGILLFTLIHLIAGATREVGIARHSSLQLQYDHELKKTEDLLQHMMPKWVLHNLLEDQTTTDVLPGVTVLFADIVGFTAYSATKAPSQVVDMLSLLFTQFDQLCVELEVYKVYTIGDCYVVMGCVDRYDRRPQEECLNVLQFGTQLVRLIKKFNKDHDTQLNMRVGIHTGTVIGSVTGTNIVRYDIYGTDVAIANAMETRGEAGRIHVSAATKAVVEATAGNFTFTPHSALPQNGLATFMVEDASQVC